MRAGSNGLANTSVQQLLFVGRALDFQSTADQALTKVFGGTNAIVTQVVAVRKSGGASIACAGGIYTAAAKGGSALVSAAQSWVTLAANVNVSATLAAIAGTTVAGSALYLSLTTGSTAAVTADVFVFGVIVD